MVKRRPIYNELRPNVDGCIWADCGLSAFGWKKTLANNALYGINRCTMGLFSGLIGGAIALALVATAERAQKKGVRDADGWKSLHASWLLHFNFVGAVALFSFFALFALNGGSTRQDAATQNLFAGGGIIFLGLLVAYIGWTYYGRTIAWRGGKVRVRNIFGLVRVKRYSEIVIVEDLNFRGEYRIKFSDGSSLAFSKNLHGAKEFISRLPRKDFWDL